MANTRRRLRSEKVKEPVVSPWSDDCCTVRDTEPVIVDRPGQAIFSNFMAEQGWFIAEPEALFGGIARRNDQGAAQW